MHAMLRYAIALVGRRLPLLVRSKAGQAGLARQDERRGWPEVGEEEAPEEEERAQDVRPEGPAR